MAIAWSIRICRQPAANRFRGSAAPTLRSHGNPDPRRRTRHRRAAAAPTGRGRLLAWLSDPRRALLGAVLVLTGAVGLDALSDPDVWWHIRLGDWIIAHHQIPAGELFAYTAFGNPLVAHEWLSETIFAALAAVGGLFLVTVLMGLVAWSAMLATLLRGRLRGAGPVVLAIGLALGARAAEPVLGTRPQVFTFALVCWTLWIAESYLRSGGRRRWLLPPLFLLWANLHAGFIAGIGFLVIVVVVEAIKRRWSLGAVAPGSASPASRVAVGASVLAACVNPYGPSLFVFAATTGATERQKGIIEWQSPNFADPAMWVLLALLLTFAALTRHVLARPRLRRQLRPSRLRACGGRRGARAHVGAQHRHLRRGDDPRRGWRWLPAWCVGQSRVAHARVARTVAARRSPVMGVALIAVGVFGRGVVGDAGRAERDAAGGRRGIPVVRDRAARAQPDDAARVHRIRHRRLRHRPAVAARHPCTSTASRSRSALPVFDRLRAHRRRCHDRADRAAAAGLERHHRGAVTARRAHRRARATPGWTLIVDDHGMLLFLRGDASWAIGRIVRRVCRYRLTSRPSRPRRRCRSTVHDDATDRRHRGDRNRQEHCRPDARRARRDGHRRRRACPRGGASRGAAPLTRWRRDSDRT